MTELSSIPDHDHSHDGGDGGNTIRPLVAFPVAMNLLPANIGDSPLAITEPGDTAPRLAVVSDGTVKWGPGGSATADTNLYRSGADSLATDDALFVAGTFGAAGNAEFSSDVAIFGNLDPQGTLTGVALASPPTITGSRVANPALASLLTALANLGLIVDSTT